jgi:hypothetical protein
LRCQPLHHGKSHPRALATPLAEKVSPVSRTPRSSGSRSSHSSVRVSITSTRQATNRANRLPWAAVPSARTGAARCRPRAPTACRSTRCAPPPAAGPRWTTASASVSSEAATTAVDRRRCACSGTSLRAWGASLNPDSMRRAPLLIRRFNIHVEISAREFSRHSSSMDFYLLPREYFEGGSTCS